MRAWFACTGAELLRTEAADVAARLAAAQTRRGFDATYAQLAAWEASASLLREAVARRAERMTGVATGPENVIVTAGGQGALLAAHELVGDPGDRALLVDPYYATYPGTIRALGLVPVAVPARRPAGPGGTVERVCGVERR